MAMSNDFAASLAKLFFQGTDFAGIATSDMKDRYYFALHTGDPGATGNQTTLELAYPEYERREIVRTASGWTITGSVARPSAPIEFPNMLTNVGGGIVTHFSLGELSQGAGMIYVRGSVTPNLNIGLGDTPRLLPATALSLVTEDEV